jgi:hypothetical protein
MDVNYEEVADTERKKRRSHHTWVPIWDRLLEGATLKVGAPRTVAVQGLGYVSMRRGLSTKYAIRSRASDDPNECIVWIEPREERTPTRVEEI